MERLTPEVIAARISDASRALAALDSERSSLALSVEEGDEAAQMRLADLDRQRPQLVEDLDRLQTAERQAGERQAAEARAEAVRSEAERVAGVRALIAGQLARVERLDAAVAEMRAALEAMRDGNTVIADAIPGAHQSIHDFNLKLPTVIDTALAIGGFQFKSMPFVAKDAAGIPDINACRLTPLYPAGWLLQLANAGQVKAA